MAHTEHKLHSTVPTSAYQGISLPLPVILFYLSIFEKIFKGKFYVLNPECYKDIEMVRLAKSKAPVRVWRTLKRKRTLSQATCPCMQTRAS